MNDQSVEPNLRRLVNLHGEQEEIAAFNELLAALREIEAAPTVGGISAGERKGLSRAAAVARAALGKAGI